ncbi:SGNH/GDSL hydrolase family protein [Nocardia africana]
MPDGDTLLDASYPVRSRRLSLSNGGLGAYTQSTLTATTAGMRLAIRLPVATTRWRLRLRNYDAYNTANKTAVTGKKIVFGKHALSTTGAAAETGSFDSNAATTIVGSDFTISGTSAYTDHDWVTDPALQCQPYTDYLVGVSWQAASSLVHQLGIGRCWYWNNITSAVDPTVAGSSATSTAQFPPLDWVFEYECASRFPAFLYIGDSIPEGTTGPVSAAIAPTSVTKAYPRQWAESVGAIVQNHSIYSSQASQWASPTWGPWTRQDTSLGLFDGAIVALGSNDSASSVALSTFQTNYQAVLANIRNIIGASKPIWSVNVTPRSLSTSPTSVDAFRLNINDWLAQLPTGIAGVVDADIAVRTIAGNALDPALKCSDNTHPCYQGMGVLAQALRDTIII